MKEKRGLDKVASNSLNFASEVFKDSRDKVRKREKIEKFNANAVKCENFTFKPGEVRLKIYWCKALNCSCKYSKCPKNNKESD